jgi:hypothetical protein
MMNTDSRWRDLRWWTVSDKGQQVLRPFGSIFRRLLDVIYHEYF